MPAESSQYLAIVFFGDHIIAALWQELNQKATIIARSSLKNLADHETLSEAVDLALEELGEQSLNIRQVLFIIPYSWTQSGQITDDHKDQLKKLSQDLLLEPLGFVVIEDGLQTWQERTQGGPFSGAMVHHHREALAVRVSLQGEVTTAFQLGKSGQARDDIIELQARLKPSLDSLERVLFFDTTGEDNDYNHLLVLLRQQLGKPVEKLTPAQVADIAITSGGQEMLGVSPETPTAAPAPAEVAPPSSSSADDFTPPSFVVQSGGTPAAPPSPSEPFPSEIENVTATEEFSPVLTPAPTKKKRRWQLPAFILTPRRSRKLLLGSAIGLGIVVLFVSSYLFLRATYTGQIAVEVANQKLETTTTLPLVLKTATNSAQLEGVAANELTETVTVTKEVPTTGTKLTGDPAKGKVVIYNKTSEPKTFAKGTKVHTNNKTFSLESEVTVASASAEETRSSRTEKFGEAEVSVVADTFGTEYNIGEKQEFTVEDYGISSYYALNDSAFTGGTSREIQAVAQKDISSALEELEQEAAATLQERLQAQATPEQPVLTTDTINVQNHQTSVAVGEEAKVVSVSLTAEGKAYQLQLSDLTTVAQTVFGDQLSEGYAFQPDKLSFHDEHLISDGAQPELELTLKAEARPEIDLNEAKTLLSGEYVARSASILGQFPGIKQVQAELRPKWLRYIFRRLPPQPERLDVEIQSENEV